jgi:hypothetical protein
MFVNVNVLSANLSRHQQEEVKGSFKNKGPLRTHDLLPAATLANVGVMDIAWELEPAPSQDEPLRLIPFIRTHHAAPEHHVTLQGNGADTSHRFGKNVRQVPRASASMFPPLKSISESLEQHFKEER